MREQCEAQLSSLARFVANDYTKHDGVALNRQFLMTSRVREVCASELIRQDRGIVRPAQWRHTLPPDCPDIQETVSFFKGRIRQLRTNQFMCYTGNMKTWKDSKSGSQTLGSVDPELWDVPSTSDFVRTMIVRTKTESSRQWVDVDHWNSPLPGAPPPPAMDAEPDALEDYMDAAFADPIPADGPENDSAHEADEDPDEPVHPVMVRPEPHRAQARRPGSQVAAENKHGARGRSARAGGSQSKRSRDEPEEKVVVRQVAVPEPPRRARSQEPPAREGKQHEQKNASRRPGDLRPPPTVHMSQPIMAASQPAPSSGPAPSASGRAQRASARHGAGWYTEVAHVEFSSSDTV